MIKKKTSYLQLRMKSGMNDDYSDNIPDTPQNFVELTQFIKLRRKFDQRHVEHEGDIILWRVITEEFSP